MAGADLGHETIPIDMRIEEDDTLFDPDRLIVMRVSPEFENSDLSIVSPVGNDATLTAVTTDLSVIKTGDIVILSGFTESGNNGRWIASGDGVAPGPGVDSTVALTKQDNVVPVAEAAGDIICWQTETNFDSNLPGVLDDRFTQSGVGRYMAYIPTFAAGTWNCEIAAYETLGGGPEEKEYRGLVKRTLRENASVQ